MTEPLNGLRVLDFTTVVSGPYATRLLADCGAEVVKVEPPAGDMLRQTPPLAKGRSRYFGAYNCGKKSIVLDFKNPQDASTARQLTACCDIIVENFRPGVMERLGVGYESVSRDNPGVVYASLSGFGQSGPLSQMPAYGPVVQAISGFEEACRAYQGEDVERPAVIGVQIADVVSGAFTFGAIQAALVNRERTGRGDWVDCALLDSVLALTTGELQAAQVGSSVVSRFPPIKARDGYLVVAPLSPKAGHGAVRLINEHLPVAQHVEFSEGFDVFTERLAVWAADHNTADAIDTLQRYDVPCSTYGTPATIPHHDHVVQRGTFTEVTDAGGSYLVNNAPFRFHHAQRRVHPEVPELGEHTDEVIASWL